MMRSIASAIVLVALGGIGSASADTNRTATLQPGKPARIAVVTALKKDCSTGEIGSIRVTVAPKNGSTSVRTNKLKTPANFRCPNVDTPVQVLFYEPNKNYQGTDELSYETKETDGTSQTYNIKLNITTKPPAKTGTGTGGGVVDL